jgi:hypothetical protein
MSYSRTYWGIHHSSATTDKHSHVQTIVDGVKRSLSENHDTLTWRRVTMPGLDVAWVGMNVPALDTGGRPWVWEIVTPSQYESSARLQEDPLVLAVAQDTVVADINHNDHSGPIMRMQVPVRQAPDAVSVMTGLDPSGPWSIQLEAGWTVQALGSAAQCWIDRESPGSARLQTPEPQLAPHQLYQLHPAIDIESAAFDRLLTLDPDDAAVVTSLLASVHEALQPYR